MPDNPYAIGLDKNAANYTPLSPLSFIERTAAVYPQRISVIHGTRRYTWGETYDRCRRLASALQGRGIGKNGIHSRRKAEGTRGAFEIQVSSQRLVARAGTGILSIDGGTGI